jgi:exodeoxyribonuclease VII large subunit
MEKKRKHSNMNHQIIQKLKEWRSKKGKEENVDLYVILHNETIEAIAEILPKNEEEFKAIKGLGGKKFERYGLDILSIVNDYKKENVPQLVGDKIHKIDKPYSVSNYLSFLNIKLSLCKARIQGEVSSLEIRPNYLYFTIKDKDDESVLNCIMWKSNYDLCGISLEEGMEIIVDGFPDIYKPAGKLSLKASTIELVGEGALKAVYEKLKKKLEQEGLFAIERKKPIPEFPQKIGLITSETGAVIHDFLNNLDKYGFKIKFVDSRVEGQIAVHELLSAINYFDDKNIDVLVIIRGGGSLESMQAFNNEILVRKLAHLPFPVIAGIGHHKDVPLLSMAADISVSTPTAAANLLNESWQKANLYLERQERYIFDGYRDMLSDSNEIIAGALTEVSRVKDYIFNKQKEISQGIKIAFSKFINQVNNNKIFLNTYFQKSISASFKNMLYSSRQQLKNVIRTINDNDPERQLKLGYSLAFYNNKIIRSVDEVSKGDNIDLKIKDGKIISQVKDINKKTNKKD